MRIFTPPFQVLCASFPEKRGHLDFPQASGTIYDFMDMESKMLGVRALGVAWLLDPNTWLLALEGEGCSGNSL